MVARNALNTLGNLAKNHSLPNYLVRYNPLLYGRTKRIMHISREDSEEAETSRAALLKRALSWAKETEYGKNYSLHLSDWPVLPQEDVKSNPDRFRRRTLLSVPAATGGSTGRPMRLWRSFECIAAEQATIDSRLGHPMLNQRVAVLRADYVKDPADMAPPYGVWRNRNRWLILSTTHLMRSTLPWFLETLSAFRPDLLWVYPTALSNLLRLAEESGANLSVPTVLSSSEMMTETLFNDASQMLRARVIDYYGQNERVCNAYCDSVREYRFDRGYGHIELITEPKSSPSMPLTARIVATGYWNSAFPLIRYDTGDRALLGHSDDDGSLDVVAQGKRPFRAIIGRADDYVIGPDGQRITGMNHIPLELESVRQIQIIQETLRKIRILALPKGELTARDRQKLDHNARELLPPYIELSIEGVRELTRLPNGKTPFIVRNVPEGLDQKPHSA